MTRLMLVDGDNILIRAQKATQHVALSADGVPTAALLVFVNSLSRHVREERPDQLVVCWDGGRSEFRTALYPKYKANRPARTEDEESRRPHGLAKQWLSLSNIPHTERAGWEADDLVAAYCRLATDRDVVVISSDHDLLQLVGDRVDQVKVATGRNPTDRWDEARVREQFRVPAARHLGAVFGLAGDPGDGVPGLPRVGHVTAVKLLAGAGWDWEALLASFDSQEGRGGWREVAQTARRLVDLRLLDYPSMGLVLSPPGRLRPTAPGDAMWPALLDFLDRLAMRTVRERLTSGELWASTEAPV